MTAQERRIVRELSAIYTVFGLVIGGWQMASTSNLDWGNVPQWVTSTVAVVALTTTIIGIAIQWRLARRRAAVDFFLKTEADKHLLDAYDEFWIGIEFMKTVDIDTFCTSKEENVRKLYFALRKYLNIHELIAVGIKNGMFDDRTCYDFWSGVLIRCVEAAHPVIQHVQARPGARAIYIELETLYARWKAMARSPARRLRT
jgi:hypothetical protein